MAPKLSIAARIDILGCTCRVGMELLRPFICHLRRRWSVMLSQLSSRDMIRRVFFVSYKNFMPHCIRWIRHLSELALMGILTTLR